MAQKKQQKKQQKKTQSKPPAGSRLRPGAHAGLALSLLDDCQQRLYPREFRIEQPLFLTPEGPAAAEPALPRACARKATSFRARM